MAIEVPVSWGELFDKITILEIKSQRIDNSEKLKNIRKELDLLSEVAQSNLVEPERLSPLVEQLRKVNSTLWDIEDDIRRCESNKDFGDTFIALARSVYITNDQRADLKYQINKLLDSALTEEKSYQQYM